MRRDNRITNPESETGMQIRLIPGPYDKEKVEVVYNMYATATPEEWQKFVYKCGEDDEWLDALYYAAGRDSVKARKEQEQYFHDLMLIEDPCKCFAASIGGVPY